MSDVSRTSGRLIDAPAPAANGGERTASTLEPRRRVAILSAWRPVPVDNGAKQRLRAAIDALSSEFDVLLICLLTPSEMAHYPALPVEGVAGEWSFPLPDFDPRAANSLLAGFGASPIAPMRATRFGSVEFGTGGIGNAGG